MLNYDLGIPCLSLTLINKDKKNVFSNNLSSENLFGFITPTLV